MSGSSSGSTVNSDLVIRARDLASQPVEALIKRVQELSAAIEVQSKLSERGQGSARDLANAIRLQEEAVKALIAQQGKLAQFLKTAGDVDQLREKQEQAARALQTFKEALGDQGAVTRDQAKALLGLEKAYESATNKIGTGEKSLARQGQALQALGVDTANTARAQEALAAAAARADAALGQGAKARSNAGLDAQRAGEAAFAASEAARVEDTARASYAAIDRQRRKAAIEEERKANEETARLDEVVRQSHAALDGQRRKAVIEAERLAVKGLADEETAQKDAQASRDRQRQKALHDAAVAEFRDEEAAARRRADALAAANTALSPLASPLGQAPGVTVASNGTANALASLLAPAAQARSTLAGVLEEVQRLSTGMASGAQTSERYTADLQALAGSRAQLARQAGLIDSFNNQQAATVRAQAALAAAKAELQTLTDTAARATTVDAALTAEITKQAAALGRLLSDYERENAALTRLDGALKAAGTNTRNLGGEMVKIVAAAKQVTEATNKANEALKQTGGLKGDTVFLGLRRYDLINLSYQVNDVFTSLSSGISLYQTAAQQGGQIFQIFQGRIISALAPVREFAAGVGGLPTVLSAVGVAAAAVGLAIGGVVTALERASATRSFEGRLAATADAGIATGRQLAEVTRQIQHFGSSFGDAQKAVNEFLAAGINPSRLVDFGRTAQNVADITGKSLPEAAKEFANSFNRGFEAVVELDRQFHFLTVTTYDQIKAAYEQKGATEGGTLAFKAFADAQQAGADKAKGEWLTATRNLTNAWHDFMDAIVNNAAIQAAVRGLATLVGAAANAVRQLGELYKESSFGGPTSSLTPAGLVANLIGGRGRSEGEGVAAKRLAAADAAVEKQQAAVDRLRASPDKADFEVQLLGLQERQLAALTAQRDRLREVASATANATAGERLRADAAAVTGENTKRAALAAHEYADELAEENRRRLDPNLRGAAQDKNVKDYLDQYEKDEKRKALAKAGDRALTQEVLDQIAIRVAARKREIDESIANQTSLAQVQQDIRTRTEQAKDEGLKGSAAAPQDARKRDEEIRKLVEDRAKALRVTPEEFLAVRENADLIAAYRAELTEKDKRKRAEEDAAEARRGASAANRELNAEESLQAQLLAIKAKADAQDKTNLEARLRSIDEEYAKTELLIARARRAGVTSVGGQSFDQFAGAIEAQKDKLKADTTLTFGEEKLNALLSQRKAEYQAINEELAEGTIGVRVAFERTSEVTGRLGDKIRQAARESVEFAKALPDQTPKVQAFIAKNERYAGQSDLAAGRAAAEAQFAAAMKPVNELIRQRADLEAAERTRAKEGLITGAEAEDKIRAAYAATSDQIRAQIADIQKLIDAQHAAGEINDTVYGAQSAKLSLVGAKTEYVSDQQKAFYQGISGSFVNNALRGFDLMAQKLGDMAVHGGRLSDVFKTAGQAFAAFAAGFLRDIATMILKAILLKAIQAGLNAVSPGLGSVLGAASSTVAHSGAVIGSANDNVRRPVDPAWFINAPRFHSGGVVGLAPDERAAILQTGEEVLSRNSVRNVVNGAAAAKGAAEGTSRPIRQVLVFEPGQLSQALAGSHGEEVVLTHLKNNAGIVRQIVR